MRCDALVVGGGPAGSTCAWILRRAGWHVIVADRAPFPRDKVCAGWVTPHVFRALDLDPDAYRRTGLTIQDIRGFRTGLLGRPPIDTRYPEVVSYAIRRCEFDDFLLRRAGVEVLRTSVETMRRHGDCWIVNDGIETRVVVGAGGHFCPVARHISRNRTLPSPVVAKEAEFPLAADARVPSEPELWFCRDLEGYGWIVRKGEYVNVGIGRRQARGFAAHLQAFIARVEATHGLTGLAARRWKGHAYLAAGAGVRPIAGDGVLLVGDAAGLAYPESGEGIRPAVESGRLAAETLVAAAAWRTEDLERYADALMRRHPPAPASSGWRRAVTRAAGRLLLSSRAFSRHVLLDRWFLRVR